MLSLAPAADLSPPPLQLNAIRRLWFCIYLPALPLEALGNADDARAVFEELKGIRKIVLANTEALAAGIRPGLSIKKRRTKAPRS